jgi:hypothetical protein
MSKQLGPIEVCCDAPPYCVVRACRGVGIRSPEDVRWLRMSTFRGRSPGHARGVVCYLRALFRGASQPASRTCTCGRALPELGTTVVAVDEGEQVAYLLGQCARCRTVFWDAS